MSTHVERPGHCAACAAELADLAERLQRLELLHLGLDETVARHIREADAVPVRLFDEVTNPDGKGPS